MRPILFVAMTMLAASANAGTRAVYDERAEDRTISFEIDDSGDFRAGRDGQYRLVLAGEAYQVAEVDGQIYVAHIDDLAEALEQTASPLLRAATRTFSFLDAPQDRAWVRLGRRTVNGRRGREYRLQELDYFDAENDPFEHTDDTTVVVSDDPALGPLGEAMLRYTAEELYLKRHFVSGASRDGVLDELDALAELGTVIASSEGDIRLASVEEAEIDPERLTLPGEPMAVDAIVALIQAGRNPFQF